MKKGTLIALNTSAILIYFALFVGVPVCGLVLLFIGMFVTGDPGGVMFIPIVLAAAGVYLAGATVVGILLTLTSIGIWIAKEQRRKRDNLSNQASQPIAGKRGSG